MKRIGKAVIYTIVVVMMVVFFLPKINLYYKAEELMQAYKVTISKESLKDSGFSLYVNDGELYYDDLAVATIDSISVTPLVLYNSLNVSSFRLKKEMEQFLPVAIDGIDIRYTIFDPLHVRLESEGAFGSLDGKIALFDRNISLHLKPSKILEKQKPFWLGRLKKDTEGGYRYESAY